MRKIWSSLLLALFLLVSQQGAVLHEISHLAATQSAPDPAGKSHVAGSACDECLAFAQIASVVGSSVPVLHLLPVMDRWQAAQAFSARDADVPAHSARDPPHLS